MRTIQFNMNNCRKSIMRFSLTAADRRIALVALSAVCCLLFCAACSMPRIIVLDDPLSPEEHLNLGVAYENNGELDNALKEYKTASRHIPSAYLYMGNVYFKNKEFKKAESYYLKAIDEDPKNADACNNLAWLYYVKRENLDEAEGLALKAVKLDPSKKKTYQDTLEKIMELRKSQ